MDWFVRESSNIWSAFASALAFDPARLLEPDLMIRIVLQILLMIGSAFFSSSETALFSLSRIELRELQRSRHPRADTLYALLDQPRRLIISILCGNEIINVAATANMIGILVQLYSEEEAAILNILIMVPLLLLFGEVTPKTIAVTNPVAVSTRVIAVPLNLWVRVITPFRWLVRLFADRVTTLLVGEEKAPENILQVDEFRTLVQAVEKRGELTPTERILIDNLLAAGSTEIVQIMIPRTRTTYININLSVPQMVEQVRRLRHRRIPVYRDNYDNIVGFIHAEDLMRHALEGTDFNSLTPEDILHPPIMVPPTKKVDEMFEFFLAHNAQAAAVLDEFGGIEGFITLTSVVNFIFGHATGEEPLSAFYTEIEPDVFEVDGNMKLTDFNTVTNFGIVDSRMTTIGGVILRHLDRLPEVGDEVVIEGIRLSVLQMDAHRISRICTTPVSARSLEDTSAEEDMSEADEQGDKTEKPR